MMNVEIRKDDRRLFARFSARYPAKFMDERNEFGQSVYLRDASAFGAHIATKDKLYLHDKVVVQVELPDEFEPLDLRGEVVWVKKNQPDFWDIGLKFHKVELLRLARLYNLACPPAHV